MRHTRRRQVFGNLSLAAGTLPFVFALVRLVSTGHDYRMFLMALAACAGAIVVITKVRVRRKGSSAQLALSTATFAVATLLAASAALLLGARSAPGVLGVSLVFGLCYAAAYMFRVRARRA